MKYNSKILNTILGKLTLVASNEYLVAILFEGQETSKSLEADCISKSNPIIKETERQLREYFKGQRSSFDLPLKFSGTEFQKKVWTSLIKIPYGQTKTYSDLAQMVKSKKAVRAVGSANKRNPLPIVIPCHRVIGKDGTLTGFASGLENKRILLNLEGVIC